MIFTNYDINLNKTHCPKLSNYRSEFKKDLEANLLSDCPVFLGASFNSAERQYEVLNLNGIE